MAPPRPPDAASSGRAYWAHHSGPLTLVAYVRSSRSSVISSKGTKEPHGGVVHQDVEPPVFLGDLREHALDLGPPGHRPADQPYVQPPVDERPHLLLGGVVGVEAVQQDGRAALREPFDDDPADAARAAGDQGDASGELRVGAEDGMRHRPAALPASAPSVTPAATKSTTLPKVS